MKKSERFDVLAEAIVHINAHRKQNPFNGDGSNYTLDQVMKQLAMISGDQDRMEAHIEATKKAQREKWNQDYIDFHARYNNPDHA